MPRPKRLLLSILALLFSFVLAIVIAGRSYLAAYLEQELVARARTQKVSLSIGSSSLGPVYWSGRNISIAALAGYLPVQIDFDELFLRLPLADLLSLKTSLDISGRLYDGAFHGVGKQASTGETSEISYSLSELSVAKIPYIQFLGIQAGKLSVELPSIVLQRESIREATGKIVLKGGAKPEKTRWTRGVPFPIDIPALLNFNLETSFTFGAEGLEISNIENSSNLGSISGRLLISQSSPQSISGFFKLDLTDEGKEGLGPYLMLLGSNDSSKEQKKYHITLDGTVKTPRWKVTAS